MSEGASHDPIDARLQEALRALVGSGDPPVDLRPRVMTAIEARATPRSDRGTWPNALRGVPEGLRVGSPSLAFAVVTLLAIAVALWVAGRGERVAVHVVRSAPGAVAGTVPQQAGASTSSPLGPGLPVLETPTPAGQGDMLHAPRVARVARGRVMDGVERGAAALPPLDGPALLEIVRIEAPPMQVARLQIDRLAIDLLELNRLDRSDKE